MPPEDSFLGHGWSFPPAFAAAGGEVETVADADDVAQALRILLATPPGERVMREGFGCDLSGLLFEEVDQRLINTISGRVRDAILDHEPRIRLDRVDVGRDPAEVGLVSISVHYTLRGTNSRYNLVFPFYLREASWTAS